MPFLSIVRRPALVKRRRIQRFSDSTQKRRYCRFGRKRRLVLLLAWETLFPTMGAFPVTWQTRAMTHLDKQLNGGPKLPVPLILMSQGRKSVNAQESPKLYTKPSTWRKYL